MHLSIFDTSWVYNDTATAETFFWIDDFPSAEFGDVTSKAAIYYNNDIHLGDRVAKLWK